MKKSELFFSVLQVFLDWIAIVCGAALAYKLRHTTSVQSLINKEGIYNFTFDQYMSIVLYASFFVLVLYAFEGLYNIRATRKIWKEMYLIFKATTIALVFVMVGFFLQREWFSSRFIIVMSWGLIASFVVVAHMTTRIFQKYFLVSRGIGQHRVLLIGSSGKLRHICHTIQTKPWLGYRIVKHIDHINLKRIKKIKKRFGIDEIIINEAEMPEDLLKKLYDYCEIHDITYKFIPSSRQTTKFDMQIFNGEPIISVNHTPLDGWGKILKRAFDIVASLCLIIVSSPLMILAVILIKLEDPKGPIVFKNARVGAGNKEFYLYKFRYMTWKWCTTRDNPDWQEALRYERELIEKHSERVGPIYKIKDDPRRMKIGRFLERFSIDELPQFFNVLKGDMSLVGPRPHQEREVENYREYHRRLLTINPGITGMAQVSGRSDLNFEDEYRLDVYYIENWSLWLDVVILLKTVPAVLKSRDNNVNAK